MNTENETLWRITLKAQNLISKVCDLCEEEPELRLETLKLCAEIDLMVAGLHASPTSDSRPAVRNFYKTRFGVEL